MDLEGKEALVGFPSLTATSSLATPARPLSLVLALRAEAEVIVDEVVGGALPA